jgi:Eco57I restriction-modification methylase/restriction endonuclease TaqI-like protein/N-6 DNA methylase
LSAASTSTRVPTTIETRVRVEFVNPFFKALGWDVTNVKGHASAYRDVIHEDRLKVGEATKAPDYSFRIGGTRKFFVETKKPSKDLKTDPRPAFQLRRYAYSAGLPVSILTDFEEFVVYDCHKKPALKDKPSVARVGYYTYRDYIAKWDEISGVFAKESIQQGAFDKYADGVKGKRGTSEIDKDFLEDLDGWRMALARNFALRNARLTERELNFAVQMTIDRLIFLRMCEARGVELYGQLQSLIGGNQIYPRLIQIFRNADSRYNSGLFHFTEERGQSSPPDTVTPELILDDKVLKGIIENTYYPACPYEFSILPVEVLGNAYEQFLGKVIRLTPGHRAKVEEKPEVRKAGGVYYTARYIVDYIVEQTVGRMIAGKTPKQVAALRILDPACGSGSFLLGAYECLLDWHLEWYTSEHKRSKKLPTVPPEKGKRKRKSDPPAILKVGDDEWALSIAEKRRILLNNIHGVDIDSQAVEVTKLSLLLKVLESESGESLKGQQTQFLRRERVLPNLSQNIKCGNSLIGPDYFASQLMPDEEEIRRINPFDWPTEFPEAMQAGGFDCVIGNPPYVRSINLKESDPALWESYRSRYRVASAREWDIYLVFVERAISLLGADGKLGYILPNKFLNSLVGENLRAILSDGRHLEKLVHFGAFQIFSGVTTYTCLLFLDRDGKDEAKVARYTGPLGKSGAICALPEEAPSSWTISEIPSSKLTGGVWEFVGVVVEKIRQWPTLKTIAQVFQGTGTRADKVYAVEYRGQEGTLTRVYSRETEEEHLLENTFLRPVLRGRSIGRYGIADRGLLLIVPYRIVDGRSILVSEHELDELAPRTLEYLCECKSRLDKREKGRFKGKGWYQYGRPQNMAKCELPTKIVLPDVANRGACYLDPDATWLLDTAYAVILRPGVRLDLRFVLAILNSPLLTHFLKETGTALRGGYFRMKTAYLNPFPIRTIDFDDAEDVARHDKLVALVERMLTLHKKLPAARLPRDKQLYERQIAATDSEIDRLVYELYNLTPEEIRIVEDATGGG